MIGRRGCVALLLAVTLGMPCQPQAFAKPLKMTKETVKQAAVIGAAAAGAAALSQKKPPKVKAPEAPKVEIPGMPEEAAPTDKKEAKQKAAEKEAQDQAALAEAFEKVRAMALAGDAQAQYIMGCAYYTGQQVEADDAEALAWWAKAARGGHPDADAYMGRASQEGIAGTTRHQGEANRRYLRAKEHGSALAAVWMGIEKYRTDEAQEKQAAIELFRFAAAQGNELAQAFLQKILRAGLDARQDFGRGLDWRKEAAKKSLPALCTEAGGQAFWGRAVPQSYEAAVKWWELSASCGDAQAQALMGTAYYTGRGVGQDYEKAVTLLKTAALQNEPLAQYALGKAYLEGNGVQKNKALAAQLLRAAGEAGLPNAAQKADRLEGRK